MNCQYGYIKIPEKKPPKKKQKNKKESERERKFTSSKMYPK